MYDMMVLGSAEAVNYNKKKIEIEGSPQGLEQAACLPVLWATA
jgi:hypothetical protein